MENREVGEPRKGQDPSARPKKREEASSLAAEAAANVYAELLIDDCPVVHLTKHEAKKQSNLEQIAEGATGGKTGWTKPRGPIPQGSANFRFVR